MSHTPGPWRVAENLFGNTASYEVYSNAETKSGKGGYTRICQITPRDQKDNAHLIAAAPDMLGKIKRLEAEKAEMGKVLLLVKVMIDSHAKHLTRGSGYYRLVEIIKNQGEAR
ncbi:MAG: hypothetical protein EOM51_11870 [Clostridia bacterium]|nr:hypothetical protein [Clostridia bacterium]